MAETSYANNPLYGVDQAGHPKAPINDDLALRLRRIVNNAFGFVKGQELSATFMATTFEDLAQQQIQRIEGGQSSNRTSQLVRVQNIEADLLQFAEKLKATDPSAFLLPDGERDVNTP